MFWMMNGMGPHGCRRMHHRGYRPMGGLFLFPGILFGGFIGIYAILAVLNVAGVVIGAVFSALAAALSGVISGIGSAFSGLMSGIGSAFSGVGFAGSVIVGVVIGVILFRCIRRRRSNTADEE